MHQRAHIFFPALALLLAAWASVASAAPDVNIDGVPLPHDVTVAAHPSALAGAWAGRFDGVLKAVLVVERIDADGQAQVVYGYGDNPPLGISAGWPRLPAVVDGDTLTVTRSIPLRFTLSPTGRLRGIFGESGGFAVLSRHELTDLMRPAPVVRWSDGVSERVATPMFERDDPVSLEVVVYRPPGAGPFPFAVVNHGSTGGGRDPSIDRVTWTNDWIADELNVNGYVVAFPQRRGRGRSDGRYAEGLSADRAKG